MALLLAAALLATGSGCASDQQYVSVRKVPQNPLAGPLQLLSQQGPRPSSRTDRLLRRYDLLDKQRSNPPEVLEKLEEEIAADPSAEKIYAFSELAYINAQKAETLGNAPLALDLYGASVAHAYQYLLDARLDARRNPYDPQFRGACDLYNGALEAALRIVHRQGDLRPGATRVMRVGNQEIHVRVVVQGAWRPEEIERLEFVSDYAIHGLTNRHHSYGLGVPLIAVRRNQDDAGEAEQYYPPGLSFAVTAFLRVLPEPAGPEADGPVVRQALLELHDPLASSHIQVAQRVLPLEADLSTPLGYFLDNPAFKEKKDVATWGLLDPHSAQGIKGLYMLEPYDPEKIPVLMVHGLWSSPVTWMEMFNDLRSFPELRDNYQFWFFQYPTGQPFWISAVQLRQELTRVRQVLDPGHRSPAMDQMVLVGHSMGGLVSRLQTLESGDDFWNLVSNRPFDQLKATPEEREKLAQALFFRPNPSIRQVITIGTPHRGSEFANDYTRLLGRTLITLPQVMVGTSQRLIRDNPGFFHNTDLLTITTSIDSLAPDSPVLPVMLQTRRPATVQYHNIVGLVPDQGLVGRFSPGGDGVVSLASAQLEDAHSEIVVPADHISIHQHPRSILEVRRILRQHLRQYHAHTAQREQDP